MAKILFTWELGAGSGHVAPYLNLVKYLEGEGHQIYHALRYLNRAQQFFNDTNVTFLQAPATFIATKDRVKVSNSYARIIHNAGYSDVDMLTALIKSWRNLYDLIKPEVIIFDYSPTAMLAARDMDTRRIAIGTGFHLPPDKKPIPSLTEAFGKGEDQESLQKFEDNLVHHINESLSNNNLSPLNQFSELFSVDLKLFRTYMEMDHYKGRGEANYLGVLKSAPGVKPEWPAASGPRVFAYLKSFKTLPVLFNILNRRKFPTLVYGDGIPEKIIKQAASDTLKFSMKPLDMTAIGQTADIAICNAGHSASCELLLSGVPMLLLPLNLEQHLVAHNVTIWGPVFLHPNFIPKAWHINLTC